MDEDEDGDDTVDQLVNIENLKKSNERMSGNHRSSGNRSSGKPERFAVAQEQRISTTNFSNLTQNEQEP